MDPASRLAQLPRATANVVETRAAVAAAEVRLRDARGPRAPALAAAAVRTARADLACALAATASIYGSLLYSDDLEAGRPVVPSVRAVAAEAVPILRGLIGPDALAAAVGAASADSDPDDDDASEEQPHQPGQPAEPTGSSSSRSQRRRQRRRRQQTKQQGGPSEAVGGGESDERAATDAAGTKTFQMQLAIVLEALGACDFLEEKWAAALSALDEAVQLHARYVHAEPREHAPMMYLALARCGECHHRLGALDKALAAYRDCVKIMRVHVAALPDPGTGVIYLGSALRMLGEEHVLQGHLVEGFAPLHEACVQLLRVNADCVTDAALDFDLAVRKLLVITDPALATLVGNAASRVSMATQTVDVVRTRARKHPSTQTDFQLAAALANLSGACQAAGDVKAAESVASEAARMLRGRTPPDAEGRSHEVAQILMRHSGLYWQNPAQRDTAAGTTWPASSASVSVAASVAPGGALAQHSAVTRVDDAGDLEGMERLLLDDALAILREMNRRKPGAYVTQLVNALLRACKTMLAEIRPAEAASFAAEALAAYVAAESTAPETSRKMTAVLDRDPVVIAGKVVAMPGIGRDPRTILTAHLTLALTLRGADESKDPDGGSRRALASFEEALAHLRELRRSQPQNEYYCVQSIKFALTYAFRLSTEMATQACDVDGSERALAYIDEYLDLLPVRRVPNTPDSDIHKELLIERANMLLNLGRYVEARAAATEALQLLRLASAKKKPLSTEGAMQLCTALLMATQAESALDRVDEALMMAAEAAEKYRSIGGRDGQRLTDMDAANFVTVLRLQAYNELRRGSFLACVAAARSAAAATRSARAILSADSFARISVALARWTLLAAAGPDDVAFAGDLAAEAEQALLHDRRRRGAGAPGEEGDEEDDDEDGTLAEAILVKQAALACGEGASPQVLALIATARAAASSVPRAHAFNVLSWALADNVASLGVSADAFPLASLIVDNLPEDGPALATAVAQVTSRPANWAEMAPRAYLFAAACADAAGATSAASKFRENAVKHAEHL